MFRWIAIILSLLVSFAGGYLLTPTKTETIEIPQECSSEQIFGGQQTTEGWLGVSSKNFDSTNGDIPTLSKALNRDDVWNCKNCWFVLNLYQTYNIKKIKVNPKVNVYISKDNVKWELLAKGISGETDVVAKIGQYIKVENWGGKGASIDVYGETLPTKPTEESPLQINN